MFTCIQTKMHLSSSSCISIFAGLTLIFKTLKAPDYSFRIPLQHSSPTHKMKIHRELREILMAVLTVAWIQQYFNPPSRHLEPRSLDDMLAEIIHQVYQYVKQEDVASFRGTGEVLFSF